MRRALVTGGSGAIGAAIARRLATDGFDVLVHAHRNAAASEAVVDLIAAAGGRARALSFDVTDQAMTRSVLEAELAEQPIHVVVHNAGITDDTLLATMAPEQWHRVIDVSLNGFYNVIQPLIFPMMRHRWGRVIAVSSVSGIIGNAGQVNYSAAKAGLHGACKALAREAAPRGITVNAIAPGIIDSNMTKEVFSPEQIRHLVPMRRSGRPEEVAALAGFLASEGAGYISGQIIAVSGAMT